MDEINRLTAVAVSVLSLFAAVFFPSYCKQLHQDKSARFCVSLVSYLKQFIADTEVSMNDPEWPVSDSISH